jgi:hypothetical protein
LLTLSTDVNAGYATGNLGSRAELQASRTSSLDPRLLQVNDIDQDADYRLAWKVRRKTCQEVNGVEKKRDVDRSVLFRTDITNTVHARFNQVGTS